ncbi:MAG: hypothetical protein FJ225_12840 [Lentisphaerae bacterium]|nr:hypothetical protein [Lentisphaerota bacterium]
MSRAVGVRALPALAGIALLAFCLRSFSDNKADVDLWGNLGFVDAPAWAPGFHYTNTFSFTDPDRPWVNHEWLAEYLLNAAYRAFGAPGLLALKVLLGLTLVGIIHAGARKEVLSGATLFLLLLLSVSVMSYGFGTRPHLFTFLLYALFLRGAGRVAQLAAVRRVHFLGATAAGLAAGALWANLHGAFFAGLLLLLVFAAGSAASGRAGGPPAARRAGVFLLAAAAFAAGSLLNPYGVRLWAFVAVSARIPRAYLSEWSPFNSVAHAAAHADFVVLAVLTLAAVLLSRRPRRLPESMALVLAFAAAILLRRNIPLFAITAAMFAAGHADAAAGTHVDRLAARLPARLRCGLLAGFAALCLVYAARFGKRAPLAIEIPRGHYPVATVRFMRANGLAGNALVFFDWAEYVIWHMYPECRVFFDGRFIDAYEARTIRDYLAFIYDWPGGERALARYPTDIVLIHKDNPAAARMRARRDWALVHAEGPALLFLARERHASLIEACAAGRAQPAEVTENDFLFP